MGGTFFYFYRSRALILLIYFFLTLVGALWVLYSSSGLPSRRFHASVVSLGGDEDKTFALVIDQLRLVRNSVAHSCTQW